MSGTEIQIYIFLLKLQKKYFAKVFLVIIQVFHKLVPHIESAILRLTVIQALDFNLVYFKCSYATK